MMSSERPDTLIVFRDQLDMEELHQMREQIRERWPDWDVIVFGGGPAFYHPDPDGDGYDLADPIPVLDGPAVAEYLEQRTDPA